jgi:hypothetical protein
MVPLNRANKLSIRCSQCTCHDPGSSSPVPHPRESIRALTGDRVRRRMVGDAQRDQTSPLVTQNTNQTTAGKLAVEAGYFECGGSTDQPGHHGGVSQTLQFCRDVLPTLSPAP